MSAKWQEIDWPNAPESLAQHMPTIKQREFFEMLRQGKTPAEISRMEGMPAYRNAVAMAERLVKLVRTAGNSHNVTRIAQHRLRAHKIRHMVIPDTQVKPGGDIEHLRWAGQYAVQMLPDVIVHIGDHWDMPSLSAYDEGKKAYEGKRYVLDIEAGITAMEAFLEPIQAERLRNPKWNPRLVFTTGNHEHRIIRAIDNDAKLEGLMGLQHLELVRMGWEVYPFLEPVVVDGIAYCHYFTSGTMGRPVSSASAMVNKKMMSCIMGHVQDKDIAYRRRADGKSITGIFAGIFYPHDEAYLNPQTNRSWRGIWILHDVQDGSFDEMPVSLSFLQDRFGSKAA